MEPTHITLNNTNVHKVEKFKNYINDYLNYTKVNDKAKQVQFNKLMNFFLYHGTGVEDVTISECQGYFNYLDRVSNYNGISSNTMMKKKALIIKFLEYVQPQKNALYNSLRQEFGIEKKTVRVVKIRKQKVQVQYPGIITEYLTFLEIGNYSHVNNYRKKILKFHRFLQKQSIDINIFYDKNKERILINQVRNYEVMLSEQIQKEEIKKSTATVYLRSIQLFFKFLYSKKLVHQKYSIPLHLRGRGSQANQYVTKEEIIEIMTAIVKSSNHVSRNLAIFLIIVDTGCRPIEVTNLKITDIDRIERAIFLGCKKTDRRKIKLSTEVMEVTKDFLKIRNEYNPIDDSLFVNGSGVSITSSLINKMFYEANIKAFGKSKHSPKAFRHTFITNALEEYSLQRVSNVIGHKEWRSTYYYYHRSNKRLLKNTVNNSPFKKEGSAENAN